MKIPTMLLRRVLIDLGLQSSDTIDKDYDYCHSRYQREGMSFLTITLPALDDALLKGLTQGRLTRNMFTGFRSVSKRRNLPALLSGYFRRIFDDDGFVLDEPDVCAIAAIRQVTRLFKKVELPCSEPRVKAAYERYRSNDGEVDWRSRNCHFDSGLFSTVSGILWSGLEVFAGQLYCFPSIFGPGATAERLKRNERNTVKAWPKRSEGFFPSSFHAASSEHSDSLSGIRFVEEEEEEPVRVVQVPKTLKTPRTISVEPSYTMLMQQSIAKPLMVWLESKEFGFQSIRFVDQSINRRLARAGSLDGSLATIDLKDASDLVSNDLVQTIFRGPCPTFLGFIQSCRTTKARMPDKTIVPLRKFASMGSALCFPIEAMVFFTIIMYALVKSSGRVPSRRLLQALAKDVAVYGDDIIVPSLMAPVVMETLEAFGLKVNHDKSFHTGLFRESCGGDYYNGVDITPVYVRQWDDTGTLSSASQLVAYTALSNTFYTKGLWHVSQSIRDHVESCLRRRRVGRKSNPIRIPKARNPIGVVHFASFIFDTNVEYKREASGYRVRGLKIKSSPQADCPSDLDGFLGLSFRSREFCERIQELKNSLRLSPSPRWISQSEYLDEPQLRLGSSREYHQSCERSRGREELSPPLSRRDVPFGVIPPDGHGSSFDNDEPVFGDLWNEGYDAELSRYESYQDQVINLRTTGWQRDPLEHLKAPQRITLYTSDRPHALCLKRGWTASQAGLQW